MNCMAPSDALLAWIIRSTPGFRGKSRLLQYWLRNRPTDMVCVRRLPGGAALSCELRVPYEAMVWLEQEEDNDLAALPQLLSPGDTFVDCGANIGLWTLTAASYVGQSGRVFSFEPNDSTVARLASAVRDNCFDSRVTVIHAACGDCAGQAELEQHPEHNNCRINRSDSPSGVTVPIVTLDEALERAAVDGIKIDVEGHELDVLRGAARILTISRPWVCIEFNTLIAGVNSLHLWEPHQLLISMGYRPRLFSARSGFGDYLSDNWETTGYTNLFYTHCRK
jgi:FkbM family methyltransferase